MGEVYKITLLEQAMADAIKPFFISIDMNRQQIYNEE